MRVLFGWCAKATTYFSLFELRVQLTGVHGTVMCVLGAVVWLLFIHSLPSFSSVKLFFTIVQKVYQLMTDVTG